MFVHKPSFKCSKQQQLCPVSFMRNCHSYFVVVVVDLLRLWFDALFNFQWSWNVCCCRCCCFYCRVCYYTIPEAAVLWPHVLIICMMTSLVSRSVMSYPSHDNRQRLEFSLSYYGTGCLFYNRNLFSLELF